MADPAAQLHLPDSESLEDLRTFATRARTGAPDGAVRLAASGSILTVSACVLPGSGLLGVGTTVGMRAMALAAPAEVDVVVPAAAVLDRCARQGDSPILPVPPMTVAAPWAALAPPRAGWERLGTLDTDELLAVAQDGASSVTAGAPRDEVWQVPLTDGGELRAGGAWAAFVLGLLPASAEATVLRHGRWSRLSTPLGHVLMR